MKSMMFAKVIAQLIFLIGAMLMYTVAVVLLLDIQKSAFFGGFGRNCSKVIFFIKNEKM